MAYFIVLGLDHPPHSMPLREAHRRAHRDYVLGQDAQIRLAGAVTDEAGHQVGSLYIFEAETAEELREWLSREPFVKAGVYRDLHILRWNLALNRLPAVDWHA